MDGVPLMFHKRLMLMKSFIPLIVAQILLPAICAMGARAQAAPSSPNFVLIFIDDMGYGDIGPYG